MNFKIFKQAVEEQFDQMSNMDLFMVDVEKEDLWNLYLDSFPAGTNPIFRERTEHDCQCCKQFIRAAGGVVAIKDNELVSIWDVQVGGYYQIVADTLASFVKSRAVRDTFLYMQQNIGTDYNHQQIEGGDIIRWEHFFFKLPSRFVSHDVGSTLSVTRSNKEVFKRSLEEITPEAAEITLELIDQNSLYRGEEHRSTVEMFLRHKTMFASLPVGIRDNYCWAESVKLGGAAKIRNTVIGTLLDDISEGKELDDAVRMFENKVAPENYKRPTAVITRRMIAEAEKKISELGFIESLDRRHATIDDIMVRDVLFANRSVKSQKSVFGELAESVLEDVKKFSKVEEVPVNVFMESILPKVDSIELLFENRHTPNLMSLVAPVNQDAKHMFKWDNNFSWTYNGEVADSIKERVRKAGGNVSGVLRCSLSWFNYDDLDIHVREPNGNHIYFANKCGKLDVDMNAGGDKSRNAVENITWQDGRYLQEGRYLLWINQFRKRENIDFGFDVEFEYEGNITTFSYNKPVVGDVHVATFEYSQKNGVKFIESLSSTQTSKECWGITSNKFHNVSLIMNSPNHWAGKQTGNKHLFFILDGCRNPDKVRGFYNEFLSEDLRDHRKVFEVLGSKMKADPVDDQLSGLGFSSTKRNSVICRVTGRTKRVIKINF